MLLTVSLDGLPRGGYVVMGPNSADIVSVYGGSQSSHRAPLDNGVGVPSTLAYLTLPDVETDAPGATTTIYMVGSNADGTHAALSGGPYFLFAIDDESSLSLFNLGATTSETIMSANSRLWLEPASTTRAEPTAWVGTEADGSDRYHVRAGIEAAYWEPPQVTAGTTGVLVFATSAEWRLSYRAAWHGVAPE